MYFQQMGGMAELHLNSKFHHEFLLPKHGNNICTILSFLCRLGVANLNR